MKKRKFTYVNAEGAREIVKAMGFSPQSYNYMLTGLVKSGVLKRSGTPQKYLYTLKAEVDGTNTS
jgi:DNA-binding IclR family transcriptional regulator